MDCAHGLALARSAGVFRQMVFGLEAVSPLGAQRCLREDFQGAVWRAGLRIRHDRRYDHQSSPARDRRKRGTQEQAIGRSRGGLTTKIVVLVDALGYLARFILLPGQRHDSVGVEPLIEDIDFEALIADKAFDQNALRRELNERGALAVIPSKRDRKTPIPYDAEMYKWRHLVENCIQRLKEWRRIATRYDKTDTSFGAFIHLSAALRAIT